MKDCIFCALGKKKENFIYENDNFFAVLDLNPKVKGHTLIIPKKHFVNTMDLPKSLGSELLDAIKSVAEKVLNKDGVEGFNVLQNNFPTANQLVMHAHFHFLPRRKDDGLDLFC